ncbi:MAG: cytochrome c-type biogenesis protein [Porticoccaceae bacterium]
MIFKSISAALLLLISLNSLAVIDIHEFSSEEIRERYEVLIEELRCPKCQNQNLAGSDSVVAEDLRREVLVLLEDGYTDQQIRTYMRDRYGDFILYDPPVEGKTLLVWVIPLALFVLGLVVIFFVVRSATRNAAKNISDEFEPESDEFVGEEDENR